MGGFSLLPPPQMWALLLWLARRPCFRMSRAPCYDYTSSLFTFSYKMMLVRVWLVHLEGNRKRDVQTGAFLHWEHCRKYYNQTRRFLFVMQVTFASSHFYTRLELCSDVILHSVCLQTTTTGVEFFLAAVDLLKIYFIFSNLKKMRGEHFLCVSVCCCPQEDHLFSFSLLLLFLLLFLFY